jgi:MFS family permease
VANVIVADLAPPNERGKYLSYYQGSFRFGSIFGPAIGGFIAELADLRTPFFLLAILGSISVVLTFFLIKEERSETPRTRTPVNVGGLLRLVFDRRLAAIEVTQMVSFITMSSIRTTMLPLYGVEYLGLPVSAIGTILSAGALVSFPVLMAISSVVDRIQRNVLIGVGFLGLAVAVYLYTLAQGFEVLLVATLVLSVSQILINPSKVAIVGDITSREVRGFAMGAFRTAGDIGFFVGPTMAGYLTDNVGVFWPFYIATTLCLLSAFIAFYYLQASKLGKIVSIDEA